MAIYRKTIIERTAKVLEVRADSPEQAEEKFSNSAIIDFLVEEYELDYEEGEPVHVHVAGKK